MIQVIKYSCEKKQEWDAFVDKSKNGTFMFKRGYMDYHSDRFVDNSLMFYDGCDLVAILPASLHGDKIISHGGLTYGGFVTDFNMTSDKMLDIFNVFIGFMKDNNVVRCVYKRVPSIYYRYPSDEDLYALFRVNAKVFARNISTTIYLPEKISYSSRRKRNIKKAIKAGITIKESNDFCGYIANLNNVLRKYHDTEAVHTGAELELLAERFSNEIKLFAAYDVNNDMMAGIVVYETPLVAHCQYIMNTDDGRKIGALDLVADYLINMYSNKRYFDFGISNEDDGKILNIGLVQQKQEFGGRGIIHDFYEIRV